MKLNIGDKVSVLDEDLQGHVTDVSGVAITIETTDGFPLVFEPHELIKTSGDSMSNISIHNVDAIISQKEQKKRHTQPKVKAKERYQPTMEVDLHIHQLTKSYKRMSNFDMLNLQMETARRQLEFAIQKRIQKIVFIHGVGEGVLKTELEYLFGRYSNIKYYDADYKKYGLGATEVYVFQNTNRQ